MESTNGCSGASTMKVAPNRVSGRVVKTSIASVLDPSATGTRKDTLAPDERPIQLRCISLTGSGQSSRSRSSTSRSEYLVIRIIHWDRFLLNTGKLPRSERPSVVTSSLARTVPSPGHQFTGASLVYANRWPSSSVRCTSASSHCHGTPEEAFRSPDSNAATSSLIGRAFPAPPAAASSYQLL